MMTTSMPARTGWRTMLHDRGGNFGLMTAILMPVLVGIVGLAIDVSNIILSHNQLQGAADAASLAASTALTDGKTDSVAAQALAKDFVAGQMANYLTGSNTAAAIKAATKVTITTTSAGGSKTFDVKVETSYSQDLTPLMNILGFKTTTIAVTSNSTSGQGETKSALSMELVLDESGSMAQNTSTVKTKKCVLELFGRCLSYQTTYVTKIEALKTAADALFDALDTADPDHKLVRTGAISYTNVQKGKKDVDWGTSGARKYVEDMPSAPSGGTDASDSMKTANTAIKKNAAKTDAESVAHAKKGNTTSDRFIVLMTDGEMTGNSDKWNQSMDQETRDECDAAKDNGITIFTVAFMAPDKGKSLLQYCASASQNYYESDTMESLVADFTAIAQTATKALTRLTN